MDERFSTNGVGAIGHLGWGGRGLILTYHLIQKLTPNGSLTEMKTVKLNTILRVKIEKNLQNSGVGSLTPTSDSIKLYFPKLTKSLLCNRNR